MPAATLSVLPDAFHGAAQRFDFLALSLPSGLVLDRAQAIEQELATPGVDGVRWLHLHDQYPETQAVSISQASTYAAAIAEARIILQMVGRYGDLTISYGAGSIRHAQVRIVGANPTARAGSLTGSGVSGTPAAAIITAWRWRATQPAGGP